VHHLAQKNLARKARMEQAGVEVGICPRKLNTLVKTR